MIVAKMNGLRHIRLINFKSSSDTPSVREGDISEFECLIHTHTNIYIRIKISLYFPMRPCLIYINYEHMKYFLVNKTKKTILHKQGSQMKFVKRKKKARNKISVKKNEQKMKKGKKKQQQHKLNHFISQSELKKNDLEKENCLCIRINKY